MKYLLNIVLLVFCVDYLHAQEKINIPCLQYHRGKFTYHDSANNLIFVKRKKKSQVEVNQNTNVYTIFRIRWNSDCEYQLEQTGTNSKSRRKYNGAKYTLTISKSLGAEGYEYTCVCTDQNFPKQSGFMKKID